MAQKIDLLVSTGNGYEMECHAELWFYLNQWGDAHPEFVNVRVPGLVGVQTTVSPPEFVENLRHLLLEHDSSLFQFVFKVIPIQHVGSSDLESMQAMTRNLYETHPLSKDLSLKYRIQINKRFSEYKSMQIIEALAPLIENPVDLQNPDWELRIEIYHETAAMALLKPDLIFAPNKKKYQ